MALISEAKRAANRGNAGLSTGPRTAEGKQAARFNALKHGMCAAETVLPGEDAQAFARLRADVLTRLRRQGEMQLELAERAARELWRLRRAGVAESGAMGLIASPYAAQMREEPAEKAELFAIGQTFWRDFKDEGFLDKLSRWEARCARGLERCVRLLKLLQAPPKPAAAAPQAEPAAPERPGEPRISAGFGFVPPAFADVRQAALGGVSQLALALARLMRTPEIQWPPGLPDSLKPA
jgi:hypothetical protein